MNMFFGYNVIRNGTNEYYSSYWASFDISILSESAGKTLKVL